tara:strand:+ start:1527 stop:1841 length:315 start_codon:yes stop_codon:yes gene_type:complete
MSERLSILLGLNFDSENEVYEDLSSDDGLEEDLVLNFDNKLDDNFYKRFLNNFKNSNMIDKVLKLYNDRKKIPPKLPSPKTRKRVMLFLERRKNLKILKNECKK